MEVRMGEYLSIHLLIRKKKSHLSSTSNVIALLKFEKNDKHTIFYDTHRHKEGIERKEGGPCCKLCGEAYCVSVGFAIIVKQLYDS
jgi:predicted transcriptional regulator